MHETIRQKRQKASLSLTYSYLCLDCNLISEAPVGLTCPTCRQPMLSLSRAVKVALTHLHQRLEAALAEQAVQKKTQVKGDTLPEPSEGNIENMPAFLTDWRTA